SVFNHYQAKETVAWFASHNVTLKTEPDGRMFPASDSSQTIIDCFLRETERLDIRIETGTTVTSINRLDNCFELTTGRGTRRARRVLIATGGSPRSHDYDFIRSLGHTIKTPIPSLFTFNDAEK